MNGENTGLPTTKCRQTRETLSEYVEGTLGPSEREAVTAHLDGCAACAREARELSAMLSILHERVPRREPVLDLWAELGPKVAAYQVEERMGIAQKVQLRTTRFLGNVAAGAILFTQALAVNTEARMRKYLTADPYRLGEREC